MPDDGTPVTCARADTDQCRFPGPKFHAPVSASRGLSPRRATKNGHSPQVNDGRTVAWAWIVAVIGCATFNSNPPTPHSFPTGGAQTPAADASGGFPARAGVGSGPQCHAPTRIEKHSPWLTLVGLLPRTGKWDKGIVPCMPLPLNGGYLHIATAAKSREGGWQESATVQSHVRFDDTRVNGKPLFVALLALWPEGLGQRYRKIQGHRLAISGDQHQDNNGCQVRQRGQDF